MAKAVRIETFGGPEVLQLRDVEAAQPGPGEALVRHAAIGLNMIDTYYRRGLYPLPLPSGLGGEAAGVVTAIGDGVSGLELGQRVAYAAPPPLDGYAEERVIGAKWLVPLPDSIDDRTAAAAMLKGLTAWFLLHRSYRVSPGEHILLYAAAGGVGSLVAQWATRIGAHVIGIVGSDAKRAAASANGCETVLLADDDIAGRVHTLTGGAGVPVVYDSVGRDTFMRSLDCLRPHGVMVSFGNSSGPVEPFSPLELARRGSLYVTRPMLFDFIRERAALEEGSRALFERIERGDLRVEIGQTYPLERVADAHRDLEGRRTRASTVIVP